MDLFIHCIIGNIEENKESVMRTSKSIRNVIVTLGAQIINILLTFVGRTVFNIMLGEECLGINTVFTQTLTVLSLAELGFGSAIIYSMYKPLADGDEKKIKALMDLYKKAYLIVALVITILSIPLIPFLYVLTKGQDGGQNLTIIYLLYVANTVVTYLYAYKRSIIIADQNMHIVTLYQYTLTSIQQIIQIIFLYMTKSFVLYLIIQILINFLINYLISKKAEKMYPYLKEKENIELDLETKNTIFRNIKAMFMHRAGDVVMNSTDSLILSAFTGVVNAGFYGNYKMILSAISGILNQIFNSVVASVGNMGAKESIEKIHSTYLSINFIGFWIYSFCTICFFTLLNPFITLWMGESSLFNMWVVFFICANFYMTGMRRATLIFRDAMGLFWYDRYKAVVECIMNLVLSIILVQKIGIAGIFLGTIFSMAFVSAWVEPYILYKYGLKRSVAEFGIRYFIYTIITVIAGTITWFLAEWIAGDGIVGLIIRILICMIVPNLIYLLIFWRTKEFQYFYNIAMKIIRRER